MANKYSPYPGDTIPAVLEDGEYVLNRNAVKAIGKDKLDRINHVEEPRFAQNGGFMENAGFPTQNKFKLGLARKMANGGIATRDAQQKRNSMNDYNLMQGPVELQGPEERMSLANLNLDNYTDEFGLEGGNLNLLRPADSFEIRKGDSEFDYPSEVEGSLPENPLKSLLGVYAKKYADRMDEAVDAIEPSMQMVGERGIEAGSKAGVLAKDIASQVKDLPKDTKKKASSLFNRIRKKFNTGKQQGKYYKDNTSIKSKGKDTKPIVENKTSKEALEALSNLNLNEEVTNNSKSKSSDKKPGSKLPKSMPTVDERDWLTETVLDPLAETTKENRRKRDLEVVRSKLKKLKYKGGEEANVYVPQYQEGGDVMDRSTAKSIGVPNVDKRMQRRLQQIRLQMQQQKLLKHRSGGDIGLYNRHVKTREESGDFLTKKQIDDTFKYFVKRQSGDIPRMQEGGMVSSVGDNMSGVQMNSRRLLNMAKRRKNVRS